MQLSGWCVPATSGNDLHLVVQMIADVEALWRTSESLTQRCSESSGVFVANRTFTEPPAPTETGCKSG